jgi:hypothetical protein
MEFHPGLTVCVVRVGRICQSRASGKYLTALAREFQHSFKWSYVVSMPVVVHPRRARQALDLSSCALDLTEEQKQEILH